MIGERSARARSVLVTGGAGFIGSHVAEALVAAGHSVHVLDDLSRGRRERVPRGATLHVVDLRDRASVERLVAEVRPAWVSHQAAQASVPASYRDPAFDAEVNLLGTLHLAGACLSVGVERFVFGGTGGGLAGEVAEGEAADEDRPPRPVSPYAVSKLAAELMLEIQRRERGLPLVTLRYANVYGPNQDPHGEAGVVAVFLERARAGEALHVFGREREGDEGCVRDYVHVRDVVRAHLRAFEDASTPALLHVATGVGTTTRALAEKILALVGRGVLRAAPPRAGDVRRSVLDASRFRALLGAPIALDEGLETLLP